MNQTLVEWVKGQWLEYEIRACGLNWGFLYDSTVISVLFRWFWVVGIYLWGAFYPRWFEV